MDKRLNKLTRVLCAWNRKEIDADSAISKIWAIYEKEALETWNDPLEKLFV